jgi:hypothetical protein
MALLVSVSTMTGPAIETKRARSTHMIGKTLIAAAFAATFAVALPAPEAKADVDVDIGIGVVPGYYAGGYAGGYHGGYGAGYGYGSGYGYGDGYGYGHRPHRNRISCGMGRNIVADAGFHRVKPVDCALPGYRYTARKNGHKYVVRVSGRGAIIDINRVY